MKNRVLAALSGIANGVVILALGALLTEGAFRIVDHFHPLFIFPNNFDVWRAQPGSQLFEIQANSRGFRDREIELPKPTGVYRILGLGDSFAFGTVPYSHNYLTLLESSLGQAEVDVVNMGIPRIGVHHYLSLLLGEGLSFDPDAVLVSFFIGNDFQVDKDGEALARDRRGSYLWTFLRYVLRIRPALDGRVRPTGVYVDTDPALRPEAHRRVLERKAKIFRRRQPIFLATFDLTVEYLDKIARICADRGLPLLVAVIPDEVQVEAEPRAQMMALVPGAEAPDFDFERPNLMLQQALSERGIEYLDLLPLLRAAAQEEPVYRLRDTHWNVAGNRVAAQAIASRVRALGWLE